MENLNGTKVTKVKAAYGNITVYDDNGNPYYMDYPELLKLVQRNTFDVNEVKKRKWVRLKIIGV